MNNKITAYRDILFWNLLEGPSENLLRTFLFVFMDKKDATYPKLNTDILIICFPPITVAVKMMRATTINQRPHDFL